MTAERIGPLGNEGAGPSSPSEDTGQKLSRGRGASAPALHLYDILLESDLPLTLEQITDQAVKRFNMSGVYAWWEERSGKSDEKSAADYRQMCHALTRQRLSNMRVRGEVLNVGGPKPSRSNPPRYTANRDKPPRWWRPRVYRPGEYVPYDPAKSRSTVGQHMAGAAWLQEARAELAKKRSTRLRELVERAIALIEVSD